jgi:hypothetical protein
MDKVDSDKKTIPLDVLVRSIESASPEDLAYIVRMLEEAYGGKFLDSMQPRYVVEGIMRLINNPDGDVTGRYHGAPTSRAVN